MWECIYGNRVALRRGRAEMAGVPDLTPVLQAVTNEEAVAYFRQKGYRIGFDHRDVWQQEHQAASTVAKATQMDLLKDIRAQVDRALADGIAFGEFKRTLMPQLMDRGWWGRRDVTDPETGETVSAQLGSTRRLRTIFEVNLSTAYQEGQWQRIQAGKGLFPFLEYGHSAAEHPRLAHKAYAGTVLPADHPWWLRHMPVKEYGCKCPVYQHSAATLERSGLQETEAPKEAMREVINQRTGELMQVPVGVDPAFHYPPGGRRASLGKMMMDKADAAGARTTARVLTHGVDAWAPLVDTEFAEFVGRYAAGERREVGTRRVAGVLSQPILQQLADAGHVPQHATLAVRMPKLAHLLGERRGERRQAKGAGEAFVASLPGALRRVGEAWLDGDHLVLLCTADDEVERVMKVVVALDTPMRGDVENVVVSMDLIDPASFTRKGLVRLLAE